MSNFSVLVYFFLRIKQFMCSEIWQHISSVLIQYTHLIQLVLIFVYVTVFYFWVLPLYSVGRVAQSDSD